MSRVPQRTTHRWLKFDASPDGALTILVSVAAEDTVEAVEFAKRLERHVMNRQPVVLDFRNLRMCTQSFLHALLFESLRLAWARRSEIHVVNATPALRSALEHLESYALGG